MGCSPLGKIVSKALGKRNGRDRWRAERMDYPPGPPTETHCTRPLARTVTNTVYVIPPDPTAQQGPEPQRQSQTPPPQPEPDHHPPQPQPEPPAPEPAHSAPPPEPKQPKRGKNKQPGRVRFGPDPPPPQQHAPDNSYPPGHGQGPAPAPQPQGYFRYTPSPLPRWEATPRRHEYFSGEYRYSYPTPVREGIYSIATDANRLTTIFSEENPNACAIV